MLTMLSVLHLNISSSPAAKRPESDRKASSKKAHANYADDGQEKQASKLLVEEDAQGDVKEAIAEGDKAADKIQAQVNKEDADFDPDNAAEDEVEAVPDDEADDAGRLHQASNHTVLVVKQPYCAVNQAIRSCHLSSHHTAPSPQQLYCATNHVSKSRNFYFNSQFSSSYWKPKVRNAWGQYKPVITLGRFSIANIL